MGVSASDAHAAIIAGPDVATPPTGKAPKLKSPPPNQDAPSKPEASQPPAPSLDDLLARLKAAKTEEEAEFVHTLIDAMRLESGSDTIDLLMFRAVAAVTHEDLPLALDLLDTVIAMKPDFAEGWNRRAVVYYQRQDYSRALADLEVVLRLDPHEDSALIGLAGIFDAMGDAKRARLALKQALDIYPLNSEAVKKLHELDLELNGRDL
ncbi:MAG: tetratricopeptide repeat protein [Ancalomicrobiaceae bacterium]|nr:tetratricopeptide repeat protein [Ancalomicrobiaceae bacterium]